MCTRILSLSRSPELKDPRDCYAPEPEGELEEVDLSLSEGVVFVDTSDLPVAESVIPSSPLKSVQQHPGTSSDAAHFNSDTLVSD